MQRTIQEVCRNVGIIWSENRFTGTKSDYQNLFRNLNFNDFLMAVTTLTHDRGIHDLLSTVQNSDYWVKVLLPVTALYLWIEFFQQHFRSATGVTKFILYCCHPLSNSDPELFCCLNTCKNSEKNMQKVYYIDHQLIVQFFNFCFPYSPFFLEVLKSVCCLLKTGIDSFMFSWHTPR